ncbi:MAG: hypothetical protein R3A78_06505 [Polyangiales bacterium]|nr:hypothetical protein [Myxococcales bacterium]
MARSDLVASDHAQVTTPPPVDVTRDRGIDAAPKASASPPEPPAAHVDAMGNAQAQTVVGPAGATLHLTNGMSLDIPSGAVTTPVEVTMVAGESSQLLNSGSRQTVSPSVEVRPAIAANAGTTFEISAPLVALPRGYSDEDLALAVERPDEHRVLDRGPMRTLWQNYPVERKGGRIVAHVDTLHGLRVVFVVTR